MTRGLLIAAVLCASARAATFEASSEAAIKEVEGCVSTLASFRESLAAKQGSLDKEFNGRTPSAFQPLLDLKRNRIAKQQAACVRRGTDADRRLSGYAGADAKALRERLDLSLKTLASLR